MQGKQCKQGKQCGQMWIAIYWTADNSAGSSLYKDCLLLNLYFTEHIMSVSIFGIRGFFKTLDSAFFKTERSHSVYSSANRVMTSVLREGLHDLFCTGALCRLHTTQVSWNKKFCSRSLVSKKPKWIGPLHDQVTWYRITHAGEQVAQWDFQNKGRSRWTGTSCFVLEVPLCNLLTSMCDFVPCDRIVQRAY